MNWDISMGRARQLSGRALQAVGARWSRRDWILKGEALEYGGRLQMRYGMLKHQVQWNTDALQWRREPIPVKRSLST